jgi:hypothetical protein
MKFSDLFEEIDTEKIPGRIGYGIRNAKTHELIKFFSNLHFFKDLQKFKSEKNNLEKLNNKEWKITNEKEFQGKRTFTFWDNDTKELPIKSDEKYPLDKKVGKTL